MVKRKYLLVISYSCKIKEQMSLLLILAKVWQKWVRYMDKCGELYLSKKEMFTMKNLKRQKKNKI
jgi:hypothetical protein